MKIQNDSRIVGVLKRVFNVRQWSDYDRLKAFTQYLGTGIKKMFIPHQETLKDSKNTFTQMSLKMNLTEQDLLARSNGLYRLSILMCILALGILGYGGYQVYQGHYKSFLISMVVSLIGLVLAFRYHFWYFQIKERKLGCTFKEWYKQGLLGKKL